MFELLVGEVSKMSYSLKSESKQSPGGLGFRGSTSHDAFAAAVTIVTKTFRRC
jgi:hypothetical protein